MTPPLRQKAKRNERASWWKWKRKVKNAGLKLNIQTTKIMASSPITAWQIDGGTMETVTQFIFLCSRKAFCMIYSAYKLNKHGDNIQPWHIPFPILNQSILCSVSIYNCCFLTCIQVCQEPGKVVWYSHLFQNSPQFVVIHKLWFFQESCVDVRVGP